MNEAEVKVKREKTVDRRLLALFLILTIAFIFQSWRTELNANAIRDGLYTACLARQQSTIKDNEGAEFLIQLTVKAPRDPAWTPEEVVMYTDQLRKGLLQTVETC